MELKRKAEALLRSEDFENQLGSLHQLPARRIINALLPLLCSPDELVKWRAVTAIGVVVARLADADTEAARAIMRRLMWSLNDESGAIGWGAPEAMGEIMAMHEGMAKEFSEILVSYLSEGGTPGGTSLENPLLVRGVLWGLGRLGQVQPRLLADAVPDVAPWLASADPTLRGLALWVLTLVDTRPGVPPQVEALLLDESELPLYLDRTLTVRRVCDLAAKWTRRT